MELLRDRSAEFDDAGVRPHGISRDSAWCHVAWRQALDLTFPVLSDWNGEAAEGFGVAFDLNGQRGVSERSAFLLDASGSVRGAWRYERSDLPDFDVLLEAARAL